MAPTHVALPKGSLIVVTGANGYIASHIVDQLLQDGYNVRGTVRAEKPWLVEMFNSKYGKGRFEAAIVSNMSEDGAYDQVTEGASGFIHVASDLSMSSDTLTVINAAVGGVVNALRAAAKQPSIKRFVLTSSSYAAFFPVSPNERSVFTSDSWNTFSSKAAWDPRFRHPLKPLHVYAASKMESERAAWRWLEENQPEFVFNTVLPDFTVGPFLHSQIRSSTMWYLLGKVDGDSAMFVTPPQNYVDVRDNAKVHVIALLSPALKNERLFARANEFNWTDVITILRRLQPENENLPLPQENEGRDLSDCQPRVRADGLLDAFYGQVGWTGLEQSLKDGIESVRVQTETIQTETTQTETAVVSKEVRMCGKVFSFSGILKAAWSGFGRLFSLIRVV